MFGNFKKKKEEKRVEEKKVYSTKLKKKVTNKFLLQRGPFKRRNSMIV